MVSYSGSGCKTKKEGKWICLGCRKAIKCEDSVSCDRCLNLIGITYSLHRSVRCQRYETGFADIVFKIHIDYSSSRLHYDRLGDSLWHK